jgi:pre-mRNA-splicing factor CDC5/CEF1
MQEARGGPTRDKVEEKARREDKKRHDEQQKKDMPRAVMQMNKLTDEGSQRKRSKLVLPTPQTSDQELQDLVKMSATAEAVSALASDKGANLLEDYSTTPAAALAATRTPRAPAAQDPLLLEAQNIIALNQTDSVLEGGENTPLAEAGGFDGLTPRHKATATPNTVLSTP